MPELSNWKLVPCLWGLWAQSWLISRSQNSTQAIQCGFTVGIVTGLISSSHPFVVASSCAIAAHIAQSLIAYIRLPQILLIALAAGSFSFFASAFYWSLLGFAGFSSFKLLEIRSLLEALPAALSQRAICDVLSTMCAFSICNLISRYLPKNKGEF